MVLGMYFRFFLLLKVEQMHTEQANSDFFLFSELLKDYVLLIGSVKVRYNSYCFINDFLC